MSAMWRADRPNPKASRQYGALPLKIEDHRADVPKLRLMANTADLRNGRDHFATGRNAVYSGRRTTRRLLPHQLRTRRSDSVSDNIFAVATRSRLRRCRIADFATSRLRTGSAVPSFSTPGTNSSQRLLWRPNFKRCVETSLNALPQRNFKASEGQMELPTPLVQKPLCAGRLFPSCRPDNHDRSTLICCTSRSETPRHH